MLENFNKLLLKDANNLDVWKLKSVIGYKRNRLLSYPANYFHSKYPNKSWQSGRKILVILTCTLCFYFFKVFQYSLPINWLFTKLY